MPKTLSEKSSRLFRLRGRSGISTNSLLGRCPNCLSPVVSRLMWCFEPCPGCLLTSLHPISLGTSLLLPYGVQTKKSKKAIPGKWLSSWWESLGNLTRFARGAQTIPKRGDRLKPNAMSTYHGVSYSSVYETISGWQPEVSLNLGTTGDNSIIDQLIGQFIWSGVDVPVIKL